MVNKLVIDGEEFELSSKTIKELRGKLNDPERTIDGYIDEMKIGDKFFYTYYDGTIMSPEHTWTGDLFDRNKMLMAEVYKTKEIAEKVARIHSVDNVYCWLENYIAHHSDWEADWQNDNQKKFSLLYSYNDKVWSIEAYDKIRYATSYMSEEMALEILDILNK